MSNYPRRLTDSVAGGTAPTTATQETTEEETTRLPRPPSFSDIGREFSVASSTGNSVEEIVVMPQQHHIPYRRSTSAFIPPSPSTSATSLPPFPPASIPKGNDLSVSFRGIGSHTVPLEAQDYYNLRGFVSTVSSFHDTVLSSWAAASKEGGQGLDENFCRDLTLQLLFFCKSLNLNEALTACDLDNSFVGDGQENCSAATAEKNIDDSFGSLASGENPFGSYRISTHSNQLSSHQQSLCPTTTLPSALGGNGHSSGYSYLSSLNSNSSFQSGGNPLGKHNTGPAIVDVHLTKTVTKTVHEDGFKMVNGYTILHELGRGAYGKVKLAVRNDNEEMRAIKIVPRKFLKEKVNGKIDNFNREVSVMKKLMHPNIVRLYEVIDDEKSDKVYMVMQYIERGPVVKFDHEARCPKLQLAIAQPYMKQIAEAVKYLHRSKIVHRDIKPDNILLGSNGMAYLADFGVSTMMAAPRRSPTTRPAVTFVPLPASPKEAISESAEVQTHHNNNTSSSESAIRLQRQKSDYHLAQGNERTRGTPSFWAPEEFALSETPESEEAEGEREGPSKCDKRPLDVWALGCTFYAMVFGKLPFGTGDVLEMAERVSVEDISFDPDEIFVRAKNDDNREEFECFSDGEMGSLSQDDEGSGPSFLEGRDPSGAASCVDLLKGMLNKDKNKRLTIRKVLRHPFLGGNGLFVESSPLPEKKEAMDQEQQERQQRKVSISCEAKPPMHHAGKKPSGSPRQPPTTKSAFEASNSRCSLGGIDFSIPGATMSSSNSCKLVSPICPQLSACRRRASNNGGDPRSVMMKSEDEEEEHFSIDSETGIKSSSM